MNGGDSRGRRDALRAIGLTGLSAVPGCSWLGGSAGGTVTIDMVEVAGTRSRETYQPVVDELDRRRDATVRLSVEEVPYENIRETLQTRVGGGDPPDVAAIDQIWLGSFVDAEVLLALDDLQDEVDVEDYADPFLDAARFDGRLYAVPTTTDVRGMYWDRAAFADAGLDPDGPPETWAELLDVAERLHDPPERYGATYFVVGGRWTVNLFAAGGGVLDDDGTEPRFHERPGVKAARFVDRLYNDRAVGPSDPPYQDGARTAREFLDGQHAISVVEGSWLDYFWRNMGGTDEEMVERFGFGPTPHPAGGEPATMSGGHMWAGFRGTDHPDVVREFLTVAAGREFKRHLAVESGQIPTRESLRSDPEIWEPMLYGEEVRSMLEHTHLRPVRNWSTVAEELDPALQQVAFDRADPEEALADAAAAVRDELG